MMAYLPTIMSSHSEAAWRKYLHKSMVNRVLELLKMEVREDMSAANITAIIRPRRPTDNTYTCLSTILMTRNSTWRIN